MGNKVQKKTKKFLKNKLTGELEARKKRKEGQKYMKKKAAPKEQVEQESEESEDEVNEAGFIMEQKQSSDEASDSDEDMAQDSEDEEVENSDVEDSDSEEQTQETMERDLKELAESDPKFYEFLKKNDEKLLEFQQDEDEDMEEEEEQVSRETIHILRSNLQKNNSLKTFSKLLKYFRKASDFEEHSSKSFNLVVMTTLKYAPIVLNHHLAEKNPSTHKKWKTLRIKVKQLLKNITVLIEKLDPTMKKFVLKQSELLTHYFNCFPKIGKDYLKILVQCWNTENEELKIVSFLCIRKLARDHPNPYLNLAFKSTFKTFMNSCRQTTAHSWTQLSFMSNCIVELGGLSLPATYQHTFVYLRQLAIKLRQASTARTKENFKLIYNWQFLHAVRLWTNLLCAYCNNDTDKNDVLKPLIYPLVQIMIGIMRLKPSSKHFPLRLAIIKCLIDITKRTNVFIPVASYLLEIFESSELKSKPKPSTLKPLDFTLNIRAPNAYLGTKTYHLGLVEQVINHLYDFYASCSLSISFPELSVPAIIQLKRMTKSKDFSMNKQIQQLIEKLEQNSKFIVAKRAQVQFGPKDIEKAMDFLSDLDKSEAPLYKYNETRLRVLERQAPKEMAVIDEDDSSDDEVADKKAPRVRNEKEFVGNEDMDDLVEDFELSDEE